MSHPQQSTPYRTVVSADGTRLAFEEFGSGPALITVTGATADRALMRPTAQELGRRFRAVTYDRRGRGDSGDTPPYAVEREVEDLAALIDVLGGRAHLYGHSSGAGLVVHALAAGLPVDRFVLHEPPYSSDDEQTRSEVRAFAEEQSRLLNQGRHADALRMFLEGVGLPEDVLRSLPDGPTWPGLLALAPTLAYDAAVMGDRHGGAVPVELLSRLRQPGLVLVGSESPAFFREVTRRVAEVLPQGQWRMLDGQEHVVPPDVLGPVVTDFLRET